MLDIPLTLHSPDLWRGLRVGLLGGSFNPPHQGHLHISRIARQRLRLDAVWWLVSPGNPLKDPHQYAPLPQRLQACESLLRHEPRMLATTIEQDLGTVRSYDTLRALRGRFSATDFIFLMGSDNALQFHQWHRWRDIPDLTALGILGRPPAQQNIRHSPLRLLPLTHRTLSRAETVPLTPQSCYWLCGHPLNPLSSTLLRNNN